MFNKANNELNVLFKYSRDKKAQYKKIPTIKSSLHASVDFLVVALHPRRIVGTVIKWKFTENDN